MNCSVKLCQGDVNNGDSLFCISCRNNWMMFYNVNKLEQFIVKPIYEVIISNALVRFQNTKPF